MDEFPLDRWPVLHRVYCEVERGAVEIHMPTSDHVKLRAELEDAERAFEREDYKRLVGGIEPIRFPKYPPVRIATYYEHKPVRIQS